MTQAGKSRLYGYSLIDCDSNLILMRSDSADECIAACGSGQKVVRNKVVTCGVAISVEWHKWKGFWKRKSYMTRINIGPLTFGFNKIRQTKADETIHSKP